jgi:L,D-transpeptidase YbiS
MIASFCRLESAQIDVNVQRQLLTWRGIDLPPRSYLVSTAKNGVGCLQGSGCTPTGLHRIRLKIGAGCQSGTVFSGRRPTGEVYDAELATAFPRRDWILTRIMWLEGLESGFNRGRAVDTLRRFIYIHGTPDEAQLGAPASHGCIRMRNADIIELFELVENYTRVHINIR